MIRAARWAMRLRSSLRPRGLAMMLSEERVTMILTRSICRRRKAAAAHAGTPAAEADARAFRRTELLVEVIDDTPAAFGSGAGLRVDPHCDDSRWWRKG